jgi:hypothetical protein
MNTERLCGLSIPFPVIAGVSDRQTWYANQLRQTYIRAHEERFREIDEAMQRENDYRIQHDAFDSDDDHFPTFDEDYSDAEMACLCSSNAGGIIATLKEALQRGK